MGTRRLQRREGFNRRHPNTRINMRVEFEIILPEEEEQFALVIDRRLDQLLNTNSN